LSDALKLQPIRKLIGSDLQGNKYYEVSPQKYLFGLREVNKQIRYVEPYGMTTRPVAAVVKVTPEWEAWLRKKRNDPPTLDELKRNVEKYNIMQERIADLEEQQSITKQETETLSRKKRVDPISSKQNKEKDSQTVDSWTADKS